MAGDRTAAPHRDAFPTLAEAAGRTAGARRTGRASPRWNSAAGTRMSRRRRGWPRALRALDAGLVALKEALGPAWRRTAVLVVTEFGRTVRANGTQGTDHGTAHGGLRARRRGRRRTRGGRTGRGWAAAAVREPRPGADRRRARRRQGRAGGASRAVGEAALARVFPGSAGARRCNGCCAFEARGAGWKRASAWRGWSGCSHELVDAAVLGQSGVDVAARVDADAVDMAARHAGEHRVPSRRARRHTRACRRLPARRCRNCRPGRG